MTTDGRTEGVVAFAPRRHRVLPQRDRCDGDHQSNSLSDDARTGLEAVDSQRLVQELKKERSTQEAGHACGATVEGRSSDGDRCNGRQLVGRSDGSVRASYE